MAAPVRAFVLPARAKFNIRLEIGPPITGGLHSVRSLVASLAVCDDIGFSPSSTGFSVICDDPDIPQEANLAYRAATSLGVHLPPISVRVSKHLPSKAGLGGGSADAAATLLGIADILAETGVTVGEDALRAAAVRTGSDVAACLVPGFKVVEGTGDLVRPLALPKPPWGVALLKPQTDIDTGEAYRILDVSRSEGARDGCMDSHEAIQSLTDAIARADLDAASALIRNDFQSAIAQAFPPVGEALNRIRAAGAPVTVLCGSGSCVAGLFPSVEQAMAAVARIDARPGEWTAATGFADE